MGRRAISISLELLQAMCTKGYTARAIKCVEGLLQDAQYVGQTVVDKGVRLIYEHPDWAEMVLQLDENVPVIPVEHKSQISTNLEFEYEDRGITRRIAVVDGCVTTDWPSRGIVTPHYVPQSLEFEVEELT